MPKPVTQGPRGLPPEFRAEAVRRHLVEGKTQEKATEHWGSARSLRRWVARQRQGLPLTSRRPGPRKHTKFVLRACDLYLLRALYRRQPDLFQFEAVRLLEAALCDVARQTGAAIEIIPYQPYQIARGLQFIGFTRKARPASCRRGAGAACTHACRTCGVRTRALLPAPGRGRQPGLQQPAAPPAPPTRCPGSGAARPQARPARQARVVLPTRARGRVRRAAAQPMGHRRVCHHVLQHQPPLCLCHAGRGGPTAGAHQAQQEVHSDPHYSPRCVAGAAGGRRARAGGEHCASRPSSEAQLPRLWGSSHSYGSALRRGRGGCSAG